MASSVVHTVRAGWRAHTALEDSDSSESSPEAPQHFRKIRSSSSFGSIRASLRQRLPLRPVQAQADGQESASGAGQRLRQLTRSARCTIGSAYQKLQKSRGSQGEYLVGSPCQATDVEERGDVVQGSARVPCRAASTTPKRSVQRTPRSASRKSPGDLGVASRTGSSRRQLVRMAALRSPFASPNARSYRRQFDQDLESLSSGLNKLKRLSHAFNDVIGKDDRAQALEHYRGVMVRGYGATQSGPRCRVSRASLKRRTKTMQQVVSSWTGATLSKVRSAT